MMRSRLFVPVVAAAFLACDSGSPGGGPTPQPDPPGTPGTPGTPARTDIAPAAGSEWYRKAVFYEVFVRSFQDSNGDGKGDLRGLISRLDYLNDGDPSTTQDLGVDALWLMPVFASPSYHGYDVVDYERIEPDYGTVEDFELLCAEAHRRGMKVIVDFVINHSGVDHPWFVESASSRSSPKRDWYQWRDQDPGWKQPWSQFSNTPTWHQKNGAYYYGVFWGGMPDLNMQNAELRAEVKRLASLWLARGVDGFRLDAARYLIETGAGAGQADTPETHAFWKEFAAHVRSVKPDAALVGENWSTTAVISKYYGSTSLVPGGDELPLNFNFPLSEQIFEGLKGNNAAPIAAKLSQMASAYPEGFSDAPFLTNHDMVRVATQLNGSLGRLTSAASLLLTLPGAPFLYYGEEVGMANGTANNDEAKRTPMPWNDTATGGFTTGAPWYPLAPGHAAGANVEVQKNAPGSLLSRYRSLIRARQSSEALSRGGLRLFTAATGVSSTLAYERFLGDERVLVVHNLTDSSASAGPFAVQGTSRELLFADPNVSNLSSSLSGWQANLPARATGIWRIK
jgi:alpha-amylase